MGLLSFLWSSGRSAVKFIQRHKKKVIFTGVIAAAYYLLTRYAKGREIDDKRAEAELENFRKKQYFSSNKKRTRITCGNLLITLKERVQQEINTDKITLELREPTSDKLILWDRLKVMSFARAICSVYSSCLLYALCTVVINVVGGYMYLEKFLFDSDKSIPPAIQQNFLHSLDYVIGPGLAELSNIVEAAADKVVSGISLKEKIKLQDIEQIIGQVRRYVEVRKNGETERTRCLVQCLLPPEEDIDHSYGNDFLEHSARHSVQIEQRLLLETRDIIDSADFHSTLGTCLNQGFAFLIDNIVEFLPASSNSGQDFYSLQDAEIAMAKLIPLMNGMIHRVMVQQLYDQFANDDLISNFEANVYECFSSVEAKP